MALSLSLSLFLVSLFAVTILYTQTRAERRRFFFFARRDVYFGGWSEEVEGMVREFTYREEIGSSSCGILSSSFFEWKILSSCSRHSLCVCIGSILISIRNFFTSG